MDAHRKLIIRISLLFACIIYGAFGERITYAEESVKTIAVGDEWAVNSDSFPEARIFIQRIESIDGIGVVVHVSIKYIYIRNEDGAVEAVIEIAHAPFLKSSIISSIRYRISTDNQMSPEFRSGYERWRIQNGGIFDALIDEAIEKLKRQMQ